MWSILRCKQTKRIRTVQLCLIKNIIIRVDFLLSTVTIKINFTSNSINLRYRTGYPCTIRHLIFQVTGSRIIKIIMSPPISFRAEKDFFSVIQEGNITHLVVKVRLVFLMNHDTDFSRLHIHFTNIRLIPRAVITLKIQTLSISRDVKDIDILIRPTVNINLLHFTAIHVTN